MTAGTTIITGVQFSVAGSGIRTKNFRITSNYDGKKLSPKNKEEIRKIIATSKHVNKKPDGRPCQESDIRFRDELTEKEIKSIQGVVDEQKPQGPATNPDGTPVD